MSYLSYGYDWLDSQLNRRRHKWIFQSKPIQDIFVEVSGCVSCEKVLSEKYLFKLEKWQKNIRDKEAVKAVNMSKHWDKMRYEMDVKEEEEVI